MHTALILNEYIDLYNVYIKVSAHKILPMSKQSVDLFEGK